MCFRFRFGVSVCYDFVFDSNCLLRLMFIVVMCPYVTILLTCLLVFSLCTYFDIIPFSLFRSLYVGYYDMIGCMTCVSPTTCADVLLDLISVFALV